MSLKNRGQKLARQNGHLVAVPRMPIQTLNPLVSDLKLNLFGSLSVPLFSETGSHHVDQAHREAPASAFQVQGLKESTTVPSLNLWILIS